MVNETLTQVSFFVPVQDLLQQVEERMRSQADRYHPDLRSALEHLLSSGGKRVRPGVTLLVGQMLGAAPDHLVTVASAIELLHTATLVHDDLIDGAFLRRGMATVNSIWTPAATVLTGDFIFARAAHLASETDSIAVMHLFSEALAEIVNGEITQLFSKRGRISREDYYQRIHAKTASLFETATCTAALLSPVEANIIQSARAFGRDIGMAFQIVDDILDFTGDQATVGKPVASDLRQGLVTLPILYFQEANPNDPDLELLFQTGSLGEGSVERLVGSIRKSGAIQQSLDEARRYIQRATETLKIFPECIERQSLGELACYFVARKL